jgi:hypothetical protein
MAAYKYLPFFDRLWFPYRLIVVTFLALALALGGLVDRVSKRRHRVGLAMGVLMVLGTALEQNRNLAYPLVHKDMETPKLYEWIGVEGGGLVEMPLGIGRISIAWQGVHGQPTYGGMAENASLFWPEGYKERLRDNRFVRALKRLTRQPDEFDCCENPSIQKGMDSLVTEGFRWVVLDRHLVDSDLHRYPYGRNASISQVMSAPFDVQAHLIEALGEPTAVDGSLVVWDLLGSSSPPVDLTPTVENLSHRSWPMDDMPAYEAHLRSQGRIE